MNTYLIVSDTIYFAKERLNELKKDITNVITFNMDENTIDEVLEEASYFSMFSEKKCIIVKNAKFFSSSRSSDTLKSKEDSEKLLNYLENENKDTLLIFIIIGKVDTKKKIYTVINEHKNVFVHNNMTKTEMKNELSKIVTQKGYKIDNESLWYIINNSDNNFDLAVNELNKLFIYYNEPSYIKYNDVVSLTSKTYSDVNFKLVDSVINRDLDSSLKYIKELKILKIEPTVIIALLYREFKLMLSVDIYEKEGCSKEDILNNLKLAPWQYDKVKSNLRNYTEREIKREIIKLCSYDYGIKSGEINKDVVLTLYAINLCE